MITKLIWFIAIGMHSCSSFVVPAHCISKRIPYHQVTLIRTMKQNSNDDTNKSKIIKLDFSEDMEEPEEKLFKPRYAFELSEFDMILLRIYVNLVTMIYICNIVLGLY
jgi:hypothetical protein